MNNKTLKDKTIILSDAYVKESGVQGGKILEEYLALGCCIMGIPFFSIGVYALVTMVLESRNPSNTAILIGALLITVIGFLLILSGYSLHRSKQLRN